MPIEGVQVRVSVGAAVARWCRAGTWAICVRTGGGSSSLSCLVAFHGSNDQTCSIAQDELRSLIAVEQAA